MPLDAGRQLLYLYRQGPQSLFLGPPFYFLSQTIPVVCKRRRVRYYAKFVPNNSHLYSSFGLVYAVTIVNS